MIKLILFQYISWNAHENNLSLLRVFIIGVSWQLFNSPFSGAIALTCWWVAQQLVAIHRTSPKPHQLSTLTPRTWLDCDFVSGTESLVGFFVGRCYQDCRHLAPKWPLKKKQQLLENTVKETINTHWSCSPTFYILEFSLCVSHSVKQPWGVWFLNTVLWALLQ